MKSVMLETFLGEEGISGYEIYEDGSLVSHKKNKPFVMKVSSNGRGYDQVSIASTKGRRTFKIHRLVALAFLPNKDKKPQVNHIDGVKTNNNYGNLEWVTNRENQLHAYEKGLNKPRKGYLNYQFDKECDNCKKVRKSDLNGNEIAIFNSLASAGRSVDKGYSTISKCCNGKGETAHGYKWDFVQ